VKNVCKKRVPRVRKRKKKAGRDKNTKVRSKNQILRMILFPSSFPNTLKQSSEALRGATNTRGALLRKIPSNGPNFCDIYRARVKSTCHHT